MLTYVCNIRRTQSRSARSCFVGEFFSATDGSVLQKFFRCMQIMRTSSRKSLGLNPDSRVIAEFCCQVQRTTAETIAGLCCQSREKLLKQSWAGLIRIRRVSMVIHRTRMSMRADHRRIKFIRIIHHQTTRSLATLHIRNKTGLM